MSNDFGYVDYTQPGAIPRIAQEPQYPTSSASRDLSPSGRYEMYYHKYSDAARPAVIKANLWGENGYFMNGPAIDPFNRAATEYNRLLSYTQSWQEPAQKAKLDKFSELLYKYGNTNSPGTLWAIAVSGFDVENDTLQQLLARDADAYAQKTLEGTPATAGSPAANQATQEEDESFLSEMWTPIEFLNRNMFSALSMPMEAVQGTIRGIGGELTNEGAEWLDFDEGRLTGALAELGSLVNPLIALWADRVRGDNEFINPWEQTDFGQTLLAASGGKGWDAFTSAQAGLDVDRAKKELQESGQYGAMNPAEFDALAVDYARTKGYYGDPGWFIDETSSVGEAQRQATFNAWAIPGPNDEMTAWTLGRGIMSWNESPDNVAYNVGSGIIDAAAAILLDPTIIAGKFGVVSKSVRGVSQLVRGADKPILIGKELKKFRAETERTVRQLNAAREIAASGNRAQAERLVIGELSRSLGRTPTKNEVRLALDEPVEITETELARMDIGELAEMTKEAERGRHIEESMGVIKVDQDRVALEMAEARRAYFDGRRLETIATDEAVDAPFETSQAKNLWDAYLGYVWKRGENGQKVYDPTAAYDFSVRFLKYDTYDGTWKDPEAKALFDGVVDLYTRWSGGKDEGLSNFDEMKSFGDALGQINVGKLNRPLDVAADQLERDVTRLYLDPSVDDRLFGLKEQGLWGTIVDSVPVKGQAALGVVDNTDSVVYWGGSRGPRLVNAGDTVDEATRKSLNKKVQAELSSPELKFANDIDDADSVVGQANYRINVASDPRGEIAALLADKDLTYGALLIRFSDLGLDGFLSAALSKTRKKVDGITDLDNVPGRTWIGDDKRVVAYRIDPIGRQNAQAIAGEVDLDEALKGLELSGITPVAVGARGLSVSDIAARGAQQRTKAAQLISTLGNYRNGRLTNAARQDQALNTVLASIDAKYADPEAALKSILGWHSGIRTSRINGITLDEAGVRAFLFGTGPVSAHANRTLQALSDFIPKSVREEALDKGADSDEYKALLQKSMGQLALVTNSKWSGDLYREVAENAINGGGRNGLIDILSPRLGIDVSAGDISRTTQTVAGDSKTWMRSVRRPNGVLARALGQMPTPRKVDLQDASQVAEAVFLYGRYAKLSDDFLADQLGKIMMHEGKFDAAPTNRGVLNNTFDEISKVLVNRIEESGTAKALFRGQNGADRKNAVINAIQNSTRLFIGGLTDTRTDDLAQVATKSDIPKAITADGAELPITSIQLETEIAHGYVGLPSVESWEAAISTFTQGADALRLAGQRFKTVAELQTVAQKFFDNFFRAGLLAFRVAYIVRNVAEMQVRMFLNGHKSILSDPATMIGMTLGNAVAARRAKKYEAAYAKAADSLFTSTGEKPTQAQVEAIVGPRPKDEWSEMFAPYRDTVLGTSFEVGNDEALAAINKVEDYFALTRSSHSLTDPRVYSASVRQGWQNVGFNTDASKFNEGWAYELMMLERSEIAKLVVGGKNAQFSSVQDGADVLNSRMRTVQEFLYEKKYERARSNLIAADEEFKAIFASEEKTMQYLYTAQNSVFNRIRNLTGAQASLLDYIRTGEFKYASGVYRPRSDRDPAKRIDRISRILREEFNGTDANGFNWAEWLTTQTVAVPWVEGLDKATGRGLTGLVNRFFRAAAKVERLGAVGPEFRLAYWDRIAELAPALRAKDIDRALNGARTTLSPLKRLDDSGRLVEIGGNHPAWQALAKAKKTNSDGLMTLDEIHELAMSYAADEITELFYDAARRNNFWYSIRLLIPFGQAWGNTLRVWTGLGAKKPIQVYKAQKALNAMIESGSSAVYEAGQKMLAYGQYAPGHAPWEQDSTGGFFYTNQNGQTSFMMPYAGSLGSVPLWLWGKMQGIATPTDIPMESPVSSLNLAMGGDSILPGVGPVGAMMINALPDDMLTEQISQLSGELFPFGDKGFVESGIPAWFSKLLGGVGAISGDAISFDALSEANKNKHLREAQMFLATTGNYPDFATNDQTKRQFQEDSVALAKALLFNTGLIQNAAPATPIPKMAVDLSGDEVKGNLEEQDPILYTIGMMNSLYQEYFERNGYDSSAARAEVVKDYGPAALFATTGDWKAFNRTPTSQALRWAQEHPDIATANIDEFSLFFPQGDSSDVEAIRWLKKYSLGSRERKNAEELFDEFVGFLERIQRFRVNSMEANGVISADEAEATREEINERYRLTGEVSGRFFDKTEELEKLNALVVKYDDIKVTEGGRAFMEAWSLREAALASAREQTGRPDATLGAKDTAPILQWYVEQINRIELQYPDFKLLATKFRREWE